MLGVDKIGEIRRAHCREGRSIKGISRPPGVSRATFRKVLWTGATEFVYERRTQPGSKIGPWQSELEGMLSENASRPKRERMTLMRIFEDLQALGCEGGDDAVRRHASRRAKVREHYGKPESQISTGDCIREY